MILLLQFYSIIRLEDRKMKSSVYALSLSTVNCFYLYVSTKESFLS